MIRTISGLVILLLLSAVSETRASTVVLLDTTKPANLVPSMLAEVRDVAGALPDGERLIVYRLGQGWIAAFDDNLNASTRIKLGQVLSATYAVKGRPDWLTCVTTAVPAAGHSGAANIIIYTAKWKAEVREGAHRSRGLLDLLKDESLAPADVRFFVRIPGDTTATIDRPNVKVITEPPNWPELISPPRVATAAQPTPATTTPHTNESTRSTRWPVVAIVLLVLAVAGVLLFTQARRFSGAKALRSDRDSLDQMARSAIDPSDEAGARAEIVHYVGLLGHENESEIVIKEGEEIFVGDHYKARPLFVADGLHVVITQKDGAVTVTNAAHRGSVFVGKLALEPGQSKRVPLVYFEMVIGKEKLTVSRQRRHVGTAADGDQHQEEVWSHA